MQELSAECTPPTSMGQIRKLQLVSIGVPVYNGERFIARCLQSLVEQDYPYLEIIISDNASSDRTSEICRDFASRFPFIRYFRQSSNKGVQQNFKKTLELASGNYFFWAGVDDLWKPGFTRALVDELESHPDTGLAMTAFDRIYEDGQRRDTKRFRGRHSPNGKPALSVLLKVTSPLKYNLFIYGMFRTSFLRKAVPYFPDIPCWDRVFMAMICLATRIRCVDKVLHLHGLNAMSVKERYPDEAVFRKKNGKAYRFLFAHILAAMTAIVLKSRIVPWYRKLYVFAGLLKYAGMVSGHQLRAVWKTFRSAVVKQLKGWKNQYLSPALERARHWMLVKRATTAGRGRLRVVLLDGLWYTGRFCFHFSRDHYKRWRAHCKARKAERRI